MRTPAGKECRFFYGDYHRGYEREECRLLDSGAQRIAWKREYCETCPVPGIQLANACPNLVLRPRLGRVFPFIKKQVQVSTFCSKTGQAGFAPQLGCGECHSLPVEFREAKK